MHVRLQNSQPSFHCGVRLRQVEPLGSQSVRVTKQFESAVRKDGRQLYSTKRTVRNECSWYRCFQREEHDSHNASIRRSGCASFEVPHTDTELKKLAGFLKELPGETRVVMERTGNYWQPIANELSRAGLFVSVVNALLIYKYGDNSLRKGKDGQAGRIEDCKLLP